MKRTLAKKPASKIIWALALAIVGILILVIGHQNSTSREQVFYANAQPQTPLSLGELSKSDRQCVWPGGISSLNKIEHLRPEYSVDEERTYDSQFDWFIVLFSEKEKLAKVIPIRSDRVPLSNDAPVCASNLKVTFDPTGRAIGSP